MSISKPWWASCDNMDMQLLLSNCAQHMDKIVKRIFLPGLFLPHSCCFLQIYSPENKGKKKLSLLEQSHGRIEKTDKLPNKWEIQL